MCGRYLLEPRAPQAISAFFGLSDEDGAAAAWQARWNLAPTQEAPVVRPAAAASGRREIVRLRWGLIPAWAKEAAIGSRMINARAETAREKPSFRAAFRARRCIVPATGWYEWRKEGTRKQPFLLRRAGAEFTAFAGLWESWKDPAGGPPVQSFTILTAAALPELADVHDRMPVVLEPGDFGRWLNTPPELAAELADLLATPGRSAWERVPVSARVNNPRHDAPDCAEPVSP